MRLRGLEARQDNFSIPPVVRTTQRETKAHGRHARTEVDVALFMKTQAEPSGWTRCVDALTLRHPQNRRQTKRFFEAFCASAQREELMQIASGNRSISREVRVRLEPERDEK